jgi:hypothetical protein
MVSVTDADCEDRRIVPLLFGRCRTSSVERIRDRPEPEPPVRMKTRGWVLSSR